MLARGSTPTHAFGIPVDTSKVVEVMVVYAQDNVEVFHKTKEDCKLDGTTISVRLDQEDTLRFDHKKNVQIQLKILLDDDVVLISRIHVVSVQQCLNDEVL